MSETLLTALALIPALVIAIVFHEVAHGWAARALGDPTAHQARRLSLNPLRHVDPLGTVIVPGALALSGAPVFGWAKPVPVNFRRLRNPRLGMMVVAAAGPATNFILAALGAVLIGALARVSGPGGGAMAEFAAMALGYFVMVNVFLGLFNLLPIPPFDGSHIVEGLLPRRAARTYARLRPLGFPLVLLLLVVVPWIWPAADLLPRLLGPPAEWALSHYAGLAQAVAGR